MRCPLFCAGALRSLRALLLVIGVAQAAQAAEEEWLCTQMLLPEQRAVVPLNSKWQPDQTLRVLLIGGTPVVREKVQKLALQWNQFSAVKLQFVTSAPAEIRASFFMNNKSWSYVGTDALKIPAHRATMNFGWLTDKSSDEEFSRVVLHEFGHALGLVHEHQNPGAAIPWDREKVYAYYAGLGWKRAEVDDNIFRLYERNTTQFTAFDDKSIMLYAIPKSLTTNGYQVGWNTQLSPVDKRFISIVYPDPATSPLAKLTAAPGIAHSGLEAGRPDLRTAPQLEAPASAPDRASTVKVASVPAVAALPRDVSPALQERMGKLENYIRNGASVRKAEQLRSDPRMSALSQKARGDFLNEFGVLMFSRSVPSRDSLIERTRGIDREQIEMEQRAFKFREDVAAFGMQEAVLEAETREHNKKAQAYEADLSAWERAVEQHNGAFEDFLARARSNQAQIEAHNAEVRNYEAQCVGPPLPPGPYARCVSWQQALNSASASLNARKAQLDAENTRFAQAESNLNARRSALQSRAHDINARKADLDSRFEALDRRRTELRAEEQKLADWRRTLDQQWQFELRQINEWLALVDRFNARLEGALAAVPRRTPAVSLRLPLAA